MMKKRVRKTVKKAGVVIATGSILVGNLLNISAAETDTDGWMEAEIENAIQQYFDKKEIFLGDMTQEMRVVNMQVKDADNNLQVMETNGFIEMANRMDIYYSDIRCSPYVLSIGDSVNGNRQVYVYEWIGIEYGSSEEDNDSDYMGFGIHHMIEVSEVKGEITVSDDVYADEYMTGVVMEDYQKAYDVYFENCKDEVNVFRNSIISEADGNPEQNEVPEKTPSVMPLATTVYSPVKAVQYAHKYCGIADDKKNDDKGTGPDGEDDTYYNKAYAFYKGRDCANFVSQCLYAGGLLQDSTWKVESYAWVNAKALANYLKGMYSSDKATNSNTYAGNPVYWIDTSGLTSGHQMICTGKNSDGVPVVDAHTGNAYRVPITAYNTKWELYTIMISTTERHNRGSYQSNSTQHWQYCDFCRKNEQIANHVISSSYGYDLTIHFKVCTICGLRIGEAAHSYGSGYSYNSTSHWKACTTCGVKKDNVGHNYINCGTYKQCRFCGYITYDMNVTGIDQEKDE